MSIEKIDPRIVRLVLDSTGKDYVHKKDEPAVDKDGRHKERDRRRDAEVLKKEIRRLNDLFESEGVDIFLVVAEDEERNGLMIKVFERSSNRLVRVLNEEEMDRILKKIMGDSGIIFDRMV